MARRRRFFGRRHASRAARSSRHRLRHHHENPLTKVLPGVAGALAFFAQVTQKDIAANSGTYDSADAAGKAKFLTNVVVGRVTGINPFSDSVKVKQTINPGGMFNKYVGLGLGALAYGKLAPKGMPYKGVMAKTGAATAFFGALGGLFDAPDNVQQSQNLSRPANYYSNSPGPNGGLSSNVM